MKLGEKVVVGYDLSDTYSQISYWLMGSDTVETISSVAGAEVFSIPTVLCKREGVSQWLYGKEALRYVQNNPGILVENLLSLAVCGEPVQIEGKGYKPEALLTLFLKRSLGMLSKVSSVDKIEALMITCENMDGDTMRVLAQVVASLGLKNVRVSFQGHKESFYYFMLHQPEELWRAHTLLCEYKNSTIQVYFMERNQRTTPIVVHIDENQYPFLSYEPVIAGEMSAQTQKQRMDEEFLELLENVCQDKFISSVYLIGEQFSEEWMKESLRFLCRGRRVFQGNNLFSKGACFCMMERYQESEVGKSHVFLGEDQLKYNIGMKIMRKGQESYFALLDAGVNWYEAEMTMEFYLHEGNVVELLSTSIIGGESQLLAIELDELPEGISRLRLRIFAASDIDICVEIEDLGFGELRPATEMGWQKRFRLSDVQE